MKGRDLSLFALFGIAWRGWRWRAYGRRGLKLVARENEHRENSRLYPEAELGVVKESSELCAQGLDRARELITRQATTVPVVEPITS